MSFSYSWTGFDRISQLLERLEDPDANPVMEVAERIIVEDNRRGVLAGLDADDQPMPITRRQLNPALAARLGDGPPLAPRGEGSRVCANLLTGHGRDPANRFQWFAVGKWQGVVSKKGVEFLPFHFEGAGRLPRRNIAGVRAWGRGEFSEAVRNWARALLRGHA